MYNYTGLKCPVCQTPFEADDDIVVCPECGAPHHRACYQIDARCAFLARHCQEFEWKPTEEELLQAKAHQVVSCPNCGTNCSGDTNFCPTCGHPFAHDSIDGLHHANDDQQNESDFIDKLYSDVFGEKSLENIPLSSWKNYIGRGYTTYLAAFARMKHSGRIFGMNLSAFFFGPIYFYYRKMWKLAAIFTAIFFALNIPYFTLVLNLSGNAAFAGFNVDLLYKLSAACSNISWFIMFVRGLFANTWYKNDISNKITAIRAHSTSAEEYDRAIKLTGGVSKKAAFLFILSVFLIDYIVARNLGPDAAAMLASMM